jgi:hypothetical protein
MRAPAVRVRDASVALPTTVTAPYPRQGRSHYSSESMPLRRDLPLRVFSESVVSGVVQPYPATSRNPATMAAQANPNLHEATQSEWDLAAEIASAMHQRPLMNRLAHVESAYAGGPPDNGWAQPPMPSQPVGATSSPTQAAHAVPVQPQRERTSPPRSSEWLSKARRERNRERLRNAFAWLSTVVIGGTIIASTIVALQA